MHKPVKSIRIFIATAASLLLTFSALADSAQKYIDNDYGFEFKLPSGWKTQVENNQGVRQIFIKPIVQRDKVSLVSCMVSVGKVSQRRNYSQSELNEFITEHPKRSEDWKRFFSPAEPEALEVLETKFATVFGNPAHYALMDDSTSQDGMMLNIRKHQYLTNTPYLSWNIACMSAAAEKSAAVDRFANEAESFQQIISSMQLLPTVAQ